MKYTGNQSSATIGHGLDSAPEMIIAKSTTVAQNWAVYHKDVGNQYWLRLNGTNAKQDEAIWNDTTPTDSVFSLNGNVVINASGSTNIAYCFHSVDGYQKVGSYGGSNPTRQTITTGFLPRFVMIKSTNTAKDWYIFDNQRFSNNEYDAYLFANSSAQEAYLPNLSNYTVEFLDNGFSVQDGSGLNLTGTNYIYLAIA